MSNFRAAPPPQPRRTQSTHLSLSLPPTSPSFRSPSPTSTTQHHHPPSPLPYPSTSSSIIHHAPPSPSPAATSADAHWASLRSALSDVSLASAPPFFDASHLAALEELRRAQLRLAQAWMTSATAATGDRQEGEVERRRRTDAHFQEVAKGVKFVAGKLDEVAQAMGRVESESGSIWESTGEEERRTGRV
ncbi:hypothetical protein EDC01DRAFT_205839 [Geopyxis carbonaria]|nr:hypothetical protein EDC01DRAFT_205839 [Geopyxis carbonaria]